MSPIGDEVAGRDDTLAALPRQAKDAFDEAFSDALSSKMPVSEIKKTSAILQMQQYLKLFQLNVTAFSFASLRSGEPSDPRPAMVLAVMYESEQHPVQSPRRPQRSAC